VAEADAVITQFAPIKADVIAAMRKARVIVRYGIGVDNIDLDAARQHGIPVCNVPDYCIDEVADHTLAFILGLTRQVLSHAQDVKAGHWRMAVPLASMKTLRDLTVGIVGCGRIGRAVLQRLVPFKCRLRAHDPVVPAAEIEACGAAPVSFPQLIGDSDVVSLHCPSTAQTRRMLNRDVFQRMKPGAVLVNVARGDLVETAALVEALRTGRLAAAALDVCDPEPIPPDSPLLRMDGAVILSAHVASTSTKAVRQLRETAAELAARVLRGEPALNVVNGVLGR
jgi:D-3-phosphoglycerate dehydrogenase